MAKTSARERFLVGSELTLFAQQKQTSDGEHNADKSLPRQRFMKKQNPGDRHDRRATGQNCGNRRERPAFLKKKEKRNRSRAHANARNQRIIKTGSAEFLIPFSAEPENRQINQDRQCSTGFDNESAQAFANAVRCEL